VCLENFDRAFWSSPAAGIFILYGINWGLGLSSEKLIRTTRFSHFASLHQPPTAELSPGDECATLNKGLPIASPIHKSQVTFKETRNGALNAWRLRPDRRKANTALAVKDESRTKAWALPVPARSELIAEWGTDQ
jgi:hypothetical protein